MRVRWLAFAALAAVGPACAASERAACGHSGVEVSYFERADLAAACAALTDIVAYFRSMGFAFEPTVSVKFVEPRRKPAEGVVAYGHADVRSALVVVNTLSHRQPWGMPWNKELMGSFLRHELTHIAVWQILGRDAGRLRHEWHEFIAYAIQLHLLEPELRRKALANFSGIRPFDDLSAVNEFTYAMNPDAFAISAYLTYREKGAQAFVRQLLRGEIVPPPFAPPFPILPEEKGS
jgi:hypothetical protein